MTSMDESFISENFNSLCRLCLRKCEFNTSIFSLVEWTNCKESIASKLIDFVNIQIDATDLLPKTICYKCLVSLEKCTKFSNQCASSDTKLRQILGDPHQAKSRDNHNYDIKEEEIPAADVTAIIESSLDYDSSSNEPSQPEDEVDFFNNVYMCQYCDQAFVTSEECSDHKKNNHNPKMPYNCQECCLIFTERHLHIQHLKQVHSSNKPFSCPECEKSFLRRSDLRKHSIVHTGIRPYKCPFCSKTFSRNNNLSKHLRIHSGFKPFVCSFCSRSFVAKGDLQRHILIHSGEKPFACSKCPLTFCRRDKLLKHASRHVNDMNKLDIQSKDTNQFALPSVPDHISGENSFNQPKFSDMLKKTALLNASIFKSKLGKQKTKRSIKCHHCTKRFPSLDAFKKHMSLHMLKSFPCRTCYKKFSRRRDLDKHVCENVVANHDMNSDLLSKQCVECGANFECKDALVAHLKAHIGVDTNFIKNDLTVHFRKDINLDEAFQDIHT